MTNFFAHARSNYFEVDDLEEFKKDLHPDITLVEGRSERRKGKIALISQDDSGWPSWSPDDPEGRKEYDIVEVVGKHFKGNPVILSYIGYEGMRYFVGETVAIYKDPIVGEGWASVCVSLEDIYEQLAELGFDNVDRPEY